MVNPIGPDSPDARDELVSAVVDGEAGPAEVAAVDADPELRARRQEFEAIGAALDYGLGSGDPDQHILSAVEAAFSSVSHGGGTDELAGRRAARVRDRLTRPLQVAAGLLLVVAVGGLLVQVLDGGPQEADLAGDGAPTADAAELGPVPQAGGTSAGVAAATGPSLATPEAVLAFIEGSGGRASPGGDAGADYTASEEPSQAAPESALGETDDDAATGGEGFGAGCPDEIWSGIDPGQAEDLVHLTYQDRPAVVLVTPDRIALAFLPDCEQMFVLDR